MALQFAVSGGCRSANTRSHYLTTASTFVINGTDRTRYVSKYECDILDVQNETPNTASIVVRGFTPTVGQQVTIKAGADKIFDGVIVTLEPVQRRTGDRLRYRLDCTDWSFLLDRLLVNKEYVSDSADTIAKDIITNFTSGFTSTNVELGLASVSLPNKMESVSQALSRLANLAGAFWYIDYNKDLHFRTTENYTNPTSLTTSNKTFKRLKYRKTIDQIRTRIYVEGQGSSVLGAVSAGDTIIPVDTTSMFDASGGKAISGSQKLTYTGVVAGGSGSVVGPGVAPSSAPTLTSQAGAGVDTGAHSYAVTYGTAAGESLPGPSASITAGSVSDPTSAPSVQGSYPSVGALTHGVNYQYEYTYATAVGETAPSPVSASVQTTTGAIAVTVPYSTDSRVTKIHIYRTAASLGTPLKEIANSNVTNNTAGGTVTLVDDTSDGGRGTAAPGSNTTAANQVALSAIPVGPTGTTSRKIYRTASGGTQLKLLTTIANNTTTTATDSTADSALGANVPTSDTSGLTQPTGQVNAGATSVLTAGASFASTSGGWAVVAGQLIRYTGVSTNTLTGVPSSGNGSVTATISYGTTIAAAPQLTGIPASGTGSLARALAAGDEINLLVQSDNTTAQTTLAALEGGDGVHEHYIQDRRLSSVGAVARAAAELTLGADPDETVTVVSEDANVFSGRSVTVNIGTISTTVKIQRVRFFWTPGRSRVQREITATNRFKGFYEYVRDLQDKASKVA